MPKSRRFKHLTEYGEVKITLEWPDKAAAWYFRFKLKNVPRIYKSTHTSDEKVARSVAINEAEKAMRSASVGEFRNVRPGGLTLAAAVELYVSTRWPERDPDNRYYGDASNRLQRFVKKFPSADLAAATTDDMIALVQAFLEERAKTKSPTTVSNDQRAISKFCVWLSKRRPPLVPWRDNPASRKHLEMAPVQKKALPPLDRATQIATMKATIGTEVWPAVVLCLGAGLRPIEAHRTQWEKIDFNQGLLRVRAKGRERIVPLAPGVLRALALSRKESGPIFQYRNDTMHDFLAAIRTEHKLPAEVSYQALRRTAAFRISREVDILTYARIMGHSLTVAQSHYLDFEAMATWSAEEKLSPNAWDIEAWSSEKSSESKLQSCKSL